MNTNLLAVLKQMTARYGEEVLDDAERVKAGLNDLAQEEPKPIRIALVLCIESRGYTALKSAADPGERAARKAVIVQRVRKGHGTDPAFSAEALDLLEAALYGAASPPVPAPPKPAGSQSAQGPVQPVPAGFVKIPGGTFMMGSPADEPGRASNETQHQVTVGSFYMGRYAVTQAEWRAVMGNNPSSFEGGSLPVECVNWYDAVEYCNKRSRREGLSPAYRINGTDVRWDRNVNGYRLPTEAEWEYACRAGTSGPFSTGNNITTSQANYNGNYPYNNNAKGANRRKTVEVGSFGSNGWGLYDMHGNVWEWCWDWYEDYTGAAQTDPAGPSAGGDRVLRGG
ncbi:MAG: formylglycine-generating enzyme family protein, partial [Treponema sp.]|nr:formylglycine-generating enzyme family protein [Treponema sp.]